MYVGECARAGSLLLHPRVTGRLAQHPTLRDEHNVAIRKLLLQLTGESAQLVIVSWHPIHQGSFPHLCCTLWNAFS